MKILIVGASEASKKIASSLSFEKIQIDIADTKEETLESFGDIKNVNKIKLDSYDIKNIINIYPENYDTMLALTDYDEFNIILAALGKEKGIETVMAKTNNAVTYNNLHLLKEKLNIDFFINEEIEVAETIKKIIEEVKITQIDNFALGKIETFIYLVEDDKQFLNLKIKDIVGIDNMLIVAIIRAGKIIIPDGDTIIKKEDRLCFMGLTKSIKKFNQTHFKYVEKESPKKIMFIGGTPLVEETAIRINSKDKIIKILDKDRKNVKELRYRIENALVTHGDYSKNEVLQLEDVSEQDYIIISTGNDEEGIALALQLKKLGAEKIILIGNNPEYIGIFDGIGIHAFINKASVVATRIIKRIRKNKEVSVYIMFNGMAEVVGITLSENAKVLNRPIDNLGLPKGIIIGGLIRENGEVIVPKGDTVLEKGDRIIIFCLNERQKELNKFLDKKASRSFFSEIINLY